jgi:hypothetical protein
MSCRKPFVPEIHKHFDGEYGTVGMEIGCDRGGMSNAIVEIMKPSIFYMVDPWDEVDNRRNGLRNSKAMRERYEEAMEQPNIKDNPVVKVLKMKSVEAFEHIPDESLDWVFIDGDHTYFGTRDDLEGVLPKMKPDGIIFGDDYVWMNTYGDEEEGNTGKVKRAADEFLVKYRDIIKKDDYKSNCFIFELNK